MLLSILLQTRERLAAWPDEVFRALNRLDALVQPHSLVRVAEVDLMAFNAPSATHRVSMLEALAVMVKHKVIRPLKNMRVP